MVVILLAVALPDPAAETRLTDTPAIVIYTGDSDKLPNSEEFPPALRSVINLDGDFSEFLLFHVEDVISPWSKVSDFSARRSYAEPLATGISLGGIEGSGSLGFFFKTDDGKDQVFALTCDHAIRGGVGVYQPSDADFAAWGKDSAGFERKMSKLATKSDPRNISNNLSNHTNAKRILQRYQGLAQTPAGRYVGDVVAKANEVKTVGCAGGQRTCLMEYALLRVEARNPYDGGDDFYGEGPSEGQLSHVQWEELQRIGQLELGMPVRKRGRTTGDTFGIVAALADVGVAGVVRQEFIVLPEGLHRRERFGVPGDSGAGVISGDGRAVGILYGGVDNARIKLIKTSRGALKWRGMKSGRADVVDWDECVMDFAVIVDMEIIMSDLSIGGLKLMV